MRQALPRWERTPSTLVATGEDSDLMRCAALIGEATLAKAEYLIRTTAIRDAEAGQTAVNLSHWLSDWGLAKVTATQLKEHAEQLVSSLPEALRQPPKGNSNRNKG